MGRISPIDIEVSDTIGDWYYFGRVEMWEKEFEFDQKAPVEVPFLCEKCNIPYMFPPDSKHCPKCRGLLTTAKEQSKGAEKNKLHFYRLMTNFREDEKIIVTDEDYIQVADQVPYTQTRRGRNRMFQVIMVAFGMVYALTLYLMALFIQAGPSIIYYTQQVTGLEWDVGNVAFVFISGAVIWAWAARYHHYVSNWEIQPLRVNSVKTPADFYILTNSNKLPVFETVLKEAKLKAPEIDRMVEAARGFPAQEIHRLQSRAEFLEDALEETEFDAIDGWNDAREGGFVTRNKRVLMKQDMQKWISITVMVAVVAVVLTIVAMTGA